MVEIDNNNNYKEYQSWFTNRMVSANKHGVPDVEEEIDEIKEDIEKVPWETLGKEEKLAIYTPAINSIRTIFEQAEHDGQIESGKVTGIVETFSSILVQEMLGVEESLNDMSLQMMKISMDIEEKDSW